MIYCFGLLAMGIIMPGTGLPKPGRMLYGEAYHLRPAGGAANLAVAVKRAGAKEVMLCAAIGSDEFGQKLRTHLETQKVNMDHVVTHQGATALLHTAVIQGGYFQAAVALGIGTAVRADGILGLIESGDHLLVDVIANHRASYDLVERASQKGAKTYLYYTHGFPAPSREVLKTLDWIITDPVGLHDLTGSTAEMTEDAMRDWASEFVREYGTNLAIQLSPAETLVFTYEGAWRWRGLKTEALDFTGAPEAWLGTLVTALAAGLPENRALARAAAAASLSTLALGAQDAMVQNQTLAEWLPDLPEPERL
jgi:ribokinase